MVYRGETAVLSGDDILIPANSGLLTASHPCRRVPCTHLGLQNIDPRYDGWFWRPWGGTGWQFLRFGRGNLLEVHHFCTQCASRSPRGSRFYCCKSTSALSVVHAAADRVGEIVAAATERSHVELLPPFGYGSLPARAWVSGRFGGGAGAGGATVVLMADSRSLEDRGYHRLAHTINACWASRHGYLMRYIQTRCLEPRAGAGRPTKRGCSCARHPTWGSRPSPWCKILAINATMHAFPEARRIVYFDSDAFAGQLAAPLDDSLFPANRTLAMFDDEPYHGSPANTGIQFWRNTPQATAMLAHWWDVETRPDGRTPSGYYDQGAMLSPFYAEHKQHIRIFGHDEPNGQTLTYRPGQRFQHVIGGEQAARREVIMREFISGGAVDDCGPLSARVPLKT